MSELTAEILQALGAPFAEPEIDFLPRGSSNGKALALPFIDARTVMSRLDFVVPGAWNFDFDLLSPDGKMVKGRLTVCGVTRCDAGESNKEDEPMKSAVSDALKRAAVHFNIGRYLYHLPPSWVPFDAQRKQWTERPRLDAAAVSRALALCGISAGRPAAAADPSGFLCSAPGCEQQLTRGQHDVSVRAYGKPLCPACNRLFVENQGEPANLTTLRAEALHLIDQLDGMGSVFKPGAAEAQRELARQADWETLQGLHRLLQQKLANLQRPG